MLHSGVGLDVLFVGAGAGFSAGSVVPRGVFANVLVYRLLHNIDAPFWSIDFA